MKTTGIRSQGLVRKAVRGQESEVRRKGSGCGRARVVASILNSGFWLRSSVLLASVFCLLTSARAATHVTATYDIGQNPRVMATVNGQPQYGLVFAQRNKPVTYNSVEYGTTVIYGYLDVNGALNDGSGDLYLDLIANLGSTPADGYYVVTFNIQGQVHAEIWVVPDQATVTADVCRQAQPPSSTAPALFYQFLQEDGNALTQRQKLNFTGAGVSCLDNAGQLRTDCTFSGGGGGSAPIASSTVSGTVKTDQTVADPVVYLTTSTDSLLATKADTAHTHAEVDVTNLVADLAAKVPTSRSVNTTTPLAGGGALSSNLTLACPTCEITGNKNAASGYAGLDASSKISGSQISEVISSADLTDFADKSGTGTTIIGATLTSPVANQTLTWNGSDWTNQAQLVTSVFSRSGAVTAQSGDYSASAVTNAADKTAENVFTAAGGVTLDNELALRLREATANGTDYFALKAPTSITTPFTLTWAATGQCPGSNSGKLTINASSEVICGDDISGGASGGYDSVAADSGTASKTSTESVKFAGTANEISTVVTADDTTQDVLTWSLPAQLNLSGKEIIGGAAPLKFEGATDNNIYWKFSVTDPTVSDKTTTVPNADTVLPQGYTCTAQFARALSGLTGATTCETIADGDIPSGITRDTEVNVQGTANEIASSGSGVAPTLSLATQLNLSGKEILGGATPVKFEGATDDNVYTTLTVTDPSLARTVTFPNADSVTVQPDTGAANNFLTAISTLGVISKAQPDFSNLSGSATDGQVPNNITIDLATSATTATTANAGDSATAFFSTGTLEATLLPLPTASTIGAIKSLTCSGTDKLSAIGTDGLPVCSTDQTSAGGGDAVSVGGSATTDANFSNTNPSAPANGFNVRWQLDTVPTPDDVSAHLLTTDIGSTTFGSGSALTWTFNDDGATSPSLGFSLGGITLTAAGTNKNITLSPSGTGIVIANNLYAQESRAADVVLTAINDSTTGYGAYISTAASTSPYYALNVLTNTSTSTLYVRADNRVGIANSTPATALDVTGVINASTGYRVNGGAASGNYLKGDGTNFIVSTGDAAGVGTPTACTNQFVTGFTLNSDAAPTSTCTTATLASAQFANQGATNQVLHGNASGNPSWAGVSLANDTAANQGTTTTVLHGNASGQPSFGSVTGSDMTAGTVTSTQLATANKTDTKSFTLFDPVAGDSGRIQWEPGKAITITRVYCSCKAATSVTINLNKRTETTPDASGTDVLSAGLVCDTNAQTSCASGCDVNTITSGAVAARQIVATTISGVTGTPDTLRVIAEYTVD